MSLSEKLERVAARHEELGALLARPEAPSSDEYAHLSKEYSDLSPIVQGIEDLNRARSERHDLQSLIVDHLPSLEAYVRLKAELVSSPP